jgi:hypothetical protein
VSIAARQEHRAHGASVAQRDRMLKYIIPLFIVGASAHADPLVVADVPTASAPGVAIDDGAPLLAQRTDVDTHSLHFDSGFGGDFGQMNLPGYATSTTGMHVVLGLRRGRVALLAEGDLADVNRPGSSSDGLYERLALESRFSFWQSHRNGELIEAYVEPGIGIESASVPNMPSFTRRDVSLAAGIQRTWQLGNRRVTWYGAVRGIEAPPVNELGEHKADFGIMLTSGLMIGR